VGKRPGRRGWAAAVATLTLTSAHAFASAAPVDRIDHHTRVVAIRDPNCTITQSWKQIPSAPGATSIELLGDIVCEQRQSEIRGDLSLRDLAVFWTVAEHSLAIKGKNNFQLRKTYRFPKRLHSYLFQFHFKIIPTGGRLPNDSRISYPPDCVEPNHLNPDKVQCTFSEVFLGLTSQSVAPGQAGPTPIERTITAGSCTFELHLRRGVVVFNLPPNPVRLDVFGIADCSNVLYLQGQVFLYKDPQEALLLGRSTKGKVGEVGRRSSPFGVYFSYGHIHIPAVPGQTYTATLYAYAIGPRGFADPVPSVCSKSTLGNNRDSIMCELSATGVFAA
jgi:hypothetical protein